MQVEATNLHIDVNELRRHGVHIQCWQDLEDSIMGPTVTIVHEMDGWVIYVRGADGNLTKIVQERGSETARVIPLLYDDEADLELIDE